MSRIPRLLLVWAAVVVALLPGRAQAFPWMIHHGYTNCAQCHIDPSGGGALSGYGRAQGEILLRTHYKEMTEEPGKEADFAFGVFGLPKQVILQADVRSLVIPDPANLDVILMQADLRGGLQAGPFTAYGSIGPVSDGAQAAWLTSNPEWNLVSREYWLGVSPAKGWLIRAGRMDLPFGIRTEDHILYVRSATRTNTNDDQQVGAAVSYGSKKLRAEVMGIAGNYQLRPDTFRERGYSGYAVWSVKKTFALGASSLLTIAGNDIETLQPRTRQAHGLYTIYAPVQPVAIMAEADVLLDNNNGASSTGLVGTGVVDWEPTQGLHLQGIGQYCDPNFADPASAAWTGGGGVQWFFTSRLDARVDAFQGVLYCTPGATPSPMGLLQAHFYL